MTIPVVDPATLASPRKPSPLALSVWCSLALHAAVLFMPQPTDEFISPPTPPASRLQAVLAPRPPPAAAATLRPTPSRSQARSQQQPPTPPKLAAKPRMALPGARQWSIAERLEMDTFLSDLDSRAKAEPNLEQRAKTMARAMARGEAPVGTEANNELLERIPDTPEVESISLSLYLDGLLKKLNRSAAFVKNDPRSRGVKTAAVLFRVNPDGSLKTFQVLNAGDQQDEIEFIRAVVERAVPFSAFPPDMKKSAKSLAMLICIVPTGRGDGGFGFSRTPDGRRC